MFSPLPALKASLLRGVLTRRLFPRGSAGESQWRECSGEDVLAGDSAHSEQVSRNVPRVSALFSPSLLFAFALQMSASVLFRH